MKQPTVQPINLTTGLAAAIARGELVELRRLPNPRIDAIGTGTLLWAREPFRLTAEHDSMRPTEVLSTTGDVTLRYEAERYADHPSAQFGKLRMARVMPRALSRLTLIVRSLRREPLQDIGNHPVHAEGFRTRNDFARAWNVAVRQWYGPHSRLRWADNPEVVVVHFQPQRANVDALLAARAEAVLA